MMFHFTANTLFEADSIEHALRLLGLHFES